MFARACRSATVRTRLDLDAVRSYLSVLAEEGASEGLGRILANGYFLGGASVGARDLNLDYRFNSARNPQTYAVHGRIQDTPDWRILRLRLTAHHPWLGAVELLFLVLFMAFHVFAGEVPAMGAVLAVAVVMASYAGANLFYIPDVVTSRVSGLVASAVRAACSSAAESGWFRASQPPQRAEAGQFGWRCSIARSAGIWRRSGCFRRCWITGGGVAGQRARFSTSTIDVNDRAQRRAAALPSRVRPLRARRARPSVRRISSTRSSDETSVKRRRNICVAAARFLSGSSRLCVAL